LTSHFTKIIESSEVEIFLKKFKDKSVEVESVNGKIISVKTTNKEIIKYIKNLGMK